MDNFSSREDLHFILLFIFLTVLYIFWTWNPEVAGLGGDNGVYLLTAHFYSPWAPPSVIAQHFATNSQYPPLYPLVLALFGGGESILAAHLITTVCLLLSFLAIRAWMLTLGLQKTTVNLAVLLIALLPGTVKLAMFILSENLYLFLSVLSLLLVSVAEKKESSPLLLLSAIVIAGATLTRTVGISLTASFCLYILIRNPVKALLPGFVTLAPVVIYSLHKKLLMAEHSSYLDALLSHYSSAPATKVLVQIQTESISLWQGWLANFESGSAIYVIGFSLILFLPAVAVRIYKRKLDGLYLLFYFVIILFWPYPAEAKRLIYPVLPIMVGQILSLINHINSLSLGKITVRPVSLFILVILISSIPGSILIAGRFLQQLPPELESYRRTKFLYSSNQQVAIRNLAFAKVLLEDMKNLNDILPGNAIIYGTKPAIISLYSKRLALLPPKEMVTDNSLQNNDTGFQPHYFYMQATTSPSYPSPYYPFELIKDRIEILHIAKTDKSESTPIIAILARLIR